MEYVIDLQPHLVELFALVSQVDPLHSTAISQWQQQHPSLIHPASHVLHAYTSYVRDDLTEFSDAVIKSLPPINCQNDKHCEVFSGW